MLSGYAPSAAAVEAVGAIGIDLQKKAKSKPGSFFWGESDIDSPLVNFVSKDSWVSDE